MGVHCEGTGVAHGVGEDQAGWEDFKVWKSEFWVKSAFFVLSGAKWHQYNDEENFHLVEYWTLSFSISIQCLVSVFNLVLYAEYFIHYNFLVLIIGFDSNV